MKLVMAQHLSARTGLEQLEVRINDRWVWLKIPKLDVFPTKMEAVVVSFRHHKSVTNAAVASYFRDKGTWWWTPAEAFLPSGNQMLLEQNPSFRDFETFNLDFFPK